MDNIQLSPHFSLLEMTATQQRGLDNTPTPEIQAKLVDLCGFLEKVHELVGRLHVNSGYRSIEVNAAVGGQSSSQHCQGEAADLLPLDTSLKDAAHTIVNSDLDYDQFIFEGSWLHVSFTKDHPPRKSKLMYGSFTNHKYLPYDETKIS